MYSDYGTKNHMQKRHKKLDGITVKQLYCALKRELVLNHSRKNTGMPNMQEPTKPREPMRAHKGANKNTGLEYNQAWLRENRLERNKATIVPIREVKHRYGPPDRRLHIRNKKTMLGNSESKRTHEGISGEEHEEAGIQNRKEEKGDGNGREWPDTIADH